MEQYLSSITKQTMNWRNTGKHSFGATCLAVWWKARINKGHLLKMNNKVLFENLDGTSGVCIPGRPSAAAFNKNSLAGENPRTFGLTWCFAACLMGIHRPLSVRNHVLIKSKGHPGNPHQGSYRETYPWVGSSWMVLWKSRQRVLFFFSGTCFGWIWSSFWDVMCLFGKPRTEPSSTH